MTVTLLRIKDQRHPFPLHEPPIRLPGDFLVRLTAARRMNDFRPANTNVSDGLDPATDFNVESVARGDPSDVSKKARWLGLGPRARRQESEREKRAYQEPQSTDAHRPIIVDDCHALILPPRGLGNRSVGSIPATHVAICSRVHR